KSTDSFESCRSDVELNSTQPGHIEFHRSVSMDQRKGKCSKSVCIDQHDSAYYEFVLVEKKSSPTFRTHRFVVECNSVQCFAIQIQRQSMEWHGS
ncbi:unnamed protein product, partial [Rotaria magnacalcarata]